MKILIVGGTGFLGTHFCEKLCQDNEITVISKHHHKFISELNNITYNYEDWRILDYDNFFRKNKYDKVLLIGWSGHPRSSNEGLLEHFESNTYPSIRLIDKIMTNTHAEIYFLSSHGGLPNIDSGFSKQSISGYAASKLSVEIHLEAYSKKFNRSATIFRLSNPYGSYQDFYGSQGIIPIFIYKALNSNKIPIYDDIETSKDYIYISDAINLMNKSIISSSNSGFSIVPIISGQKLSILDILSHIELHIPILDLIPVELKSKVKSHSKELLHLLSSSSLHKNLNIQLEGLVRWIKENS
jgi:nucleoside-diphosphate-sugar epimerase